MLGPAKGRTRVPGSDRRVCGAGGALMSWWQRLTGGLKRTSSALGTALTDLVTKRKLDAAMVEELEEVLIRADLGEIGRAHV